MNSVSVYTNFTLKKIAFLFFVFTSGISHAQLTPNFSANPISGCVPLTVNFFDNSTGNPQRWKWDLGNGTIAALQNPTTSYIIPGVYSITLKVFNNNDSNSITKTQYITVYPKPIVNFEADITAGCSPLICNFTDLSSSSITNNTSWKWDFNDDSISYIQNPQHKFILPGNYNISLKVTNSAGCSSTYSKLAYIKVDDSFKASFSYSNPVKCNPPETINFTNTSTGSGTISYYWDFGDGGNSTTVNPSYTYLNAGTFSPKLISKNNNGCIDSVTRQNAINLNTTISTFTGPDTLCMGATAIFSNISTPVPQTVLWNFGDGTSATLNTVSKSWDTSGNFNIKLVNQYAACADSVTRKITIINKPSVNFKADDSASCIAPFTVNFTNLSSNAINWEWNFGDGSTSTFQNPSHTYTSNGQYNVSLKIWDSLGCTGNLIQYNFIRILKPLVNINLRNAEGCIPFIFKPLPNISSVDGIASYFWDFGNGSTSTNPFPTTIYPDSGTYTIKLIATSNDGCIDSIIINNAVRTGTHPIVNFSANNTNECTNTNIKFSDSSIKVDRWLWNFGDGQTDTLKNPTHAYQDTGKYSVKLIAWNNGCSDSITRLNYISILPSISRFKPIFNCTNKKEVFFKDSSIQALTWLWKFGDGDSSDLPSPVHLYAQYQTYLVTLTTSNGGCTSTRTISIKTINELPDFTIATDSICKSTTSIFTAFNFNKVNISKYIWDFGDGIIDSSFLDIANHQYTQAGIFTIKLTIIDLHNCYETVTKNNLVQVFNPKAGYYINTPGGCINNAVNFFDTSNTSGNLFNIKQWDWDFGDGQSAVFNAPIPISISHEYNTTGSYYPILKITDSIGCTDSVRHIQPITITKPVAQFFAVNYLSCTTDTVDYRSLSSGVGLNYLWSFGDSTYSTITNPKKQYLNNGNYSVKLVVTDINGCKDSSENINYIKVQDVKASFTVNDSAGVCIPFEVNFTNNSSGMLSHIWEFGDENTSLAFNPTYYYTVTGNYTVKLTAKRTAKCSSSYQMKISVKAPSADISYTPLNGCAPLVVSFITSPLNNLVYSWDFNDGNISLSTDSVTTHTYLTNGRFIPKVIIRDTFGCFVPVSGVDTIKLRSSTVKFGVDKPLLCDSGIVKFIDSTISGGIINSYKWKFGDAGTATIKDPTHLYASTGFYNVSLTVTTVYGCKDSMVIPNFIKVVKKPNIGIAGNNSFCGPNNVSLQGLLLSIDTSVIIWKWEYFNGATSQLQNPPAFNYTTTGNYPVVLTVMNSSGCTDTISTTTFIHPIPKTFAGNDTTRCLNTPLQLTASGADFYSWFPAINLSCTNCINPITDIQNSGLYYVKGRSIYGCEKTDSVYVTVKKPFTINGLQPLDSICSSKSIQLSISGAEFYIWTPADGLSNNKINNPIATPINNTTYKVVGFDAAKCYYDSLTIKIIVNKTPTVNAGNEKTILMGASETLLPVFSNDVISWKWTPAEFLSCNVCPYPIITPLKNNNYKLEVTNNKGCSASDNIFIRVFCNNSVLVLPTAFSPDNNNLNDIFYPISFGSGGLKIISFNIFNRFGQLIYQKGNFYPNDKSSGWDGTNKGIKLNPDVFVYTLEVICDNGSALNYRGNITLVK